MPLSGRSNVPTTPPPPAAFRRAKTSAVDPRLMAEMVQAGDFDRLVTIEEAITDRAPSGARTVTSWRVPEGLPLGMIPAAVGQQVGTEGHAAELVTDQALQRVVLAGYFPQLVVSEEGPQYRCRVDDGRAFDVVGVEHGKLRAQTTLTCRTLRPQGSDSA